MRAGGFGEAGADAVYLAERVVGDVSDSNV